MIQSKQQSKQEQKPLDIKNIPTESESLPPLPQPEKLDDDSKLERGKQAERFIESPEYKYMLELIEREIHKCKLAILDTPRKDIAQFQELKIEIDVLLRLKNAAHFDVNTSNRILAERLKKG